MDNERNELVPKKQSLFPLSGEDIVENALANLTEDQAREVTTKAADEIVRLAIERRKAEFRNVTAHDEMNNLIKNAEMLEKSVAYYQINSTFETASGTTNVEIRKSRFTHITAIVIVIGIVIAGLVILASLLQR